jgi:bifunctional DNA-binding transcriptional regulator/antitoxin component of YhaV-PrlF toxin-antitoxin module
MSASRETTKTVRVQLGGRLTLPLELRQKYGIRPGDALRVVDLDGTFVLMPMTKSVAELAREIEQARLEAGLNTADLLRSLRQERASYVQETYGDEAEV